MYEHRGAGAVAARGLRAAPSGGYAERILVGRRGRSVCSSHLVAGGLPLPRRRRKPVVPGGSPATSRADSALGGPTANGGVRKCASNAALYDQAVVWARMRPQSRWVGAYLVLVTSVAVFEIVGAADAGFNAYLVLCTLLLPLGLLFPLALFLVDAVVGNLGPAVTISCEFIFIIIVAYGNARLVGRIARGVRVRMTSR